MESKARKEDEGAGGGGFIFEEKKGEILMKQLTFDAGPEGREGPLWLSGGKHIPGRGRESAKALRQKYAWCFLPEGEQGGQRD